MDYPADTRGYTDGVVLEYENPWLAARGAITAVSTEANGPEPRVQVAESRRLHLSRENTESIKGTPGRYGCYCSRTTRAPEITMQRSRRSRSAPTLRQCQRSLSSYGGKKGGVNINAEQELSRGLGAFLRASWNDGEYASWEFTEMDRSLSLGLSFDGGLWKRKDDGAGIAMVVNGISAAHRDFLQAGGLGFIVGDGRLTHYGPELITEWYYRVKVLPSLDATADYQIIGNPAYNNDRGPVNVFGLRVHVEF